MKKSLALKQKFLLITGWGCGIQPLEPLKKALEQRGHAVELWNIFNVLDQHILQQKVALAHGFDAIVGWSLGGQLATLLVEQIELRYTEQKVLISLASNPCFVADTTWQTAMSSLNFQQFKHSFEQDHIATLKKFGYMMCQGMSTLKLDFLTLQNLIQPQPIPLLKQGLILLEKLNTVSILKKYAGHQYHIFAEQDTLVDYKITQKFAEFEAKFLKVTGIKGSHACPLFQTQQITDKICQYLQEIN